MEHEELADALGLKTYQARTALKQAVHNLKVFDAKQQDYGPNNIAGNPCPELGVAIRANDKIQRLMNLLYNQQTPNNESVQDAWSDLANYGLIGSLLNSDQWLEPQIQQSQIQF